MLIGQEKFPTRQFKYGEELKVGAVSLRIHKDFGIVVQCSDPASDHIEITLGFETELVLSSGAKPVKLLKFQTVSSWCGSEGVSVSVGSPITNIDKLRVIKVLLLKENHSEDVR